MFARIVEFSPTSDAAAQFVEVVGETALRIVKGQSGCVAAWVKLRPVADWIVLVSRIDYSDRLRPSGDASAEKFPQARRIASVWAGVRFLNLNP